MTVQQGDDAQHVLVVLIIAHGLGVGIEERHILLLEELAAELIDVHRFIITIDIGIVEGLLRDEVHDILVFIEAHHRTVHPRLVLCHEGEIGIGVFEDHGEEAIAEDEVALYQEGIVLLELLLDHRERVDVVGLVVDGVFDEVDVECGMWNEEGGLDIFLQFFSFIAYYDDDAGEGECRQLSQEAVDKSHAVHGYHTLRVLLRQFS